MVRALFFDDVEIRGIAFVFELIIVVVTCVCDVFGLSIFEGD